MPLWSLTKERVESLIEQMNKKKDEHDLLEKMEVFDIWNSDLDKMLQCLTDVEA